MGEVTLTVWSTSILTTIMHCHFHRLVLRHLQATSLPMIHIPLLRTRGWHMPASKVISLTQRAGASSPSDRQVGPSAAAGSSCCKRDVFQEASLIYTELEMHLS